MNLLNKNKRFVVVILAIFIVTIYSRIFYKYSSFNEEVISSSEPNPGQVFQEPLKPEIFELIIDFEDPFRLNARDKFVDVETKRKVHSTSKLNTNKTRRIPKRERSIWPNVVYSGHMISSKSQVGVIKVNGKTKLFEVGDTIEGIKIIEMNDDKVLCHFGGKDSVLTLRKKPAFQ